MEIITTDRHADGAYVHSYVTRTLPDQADGVRRLTEMCGGCFAGCKMSNVDPAGNVRACRFWGHVTLGNVRQRKFSEIWRDSNSAVLEQLRAKNEPATENRAQCIHDEVCGGFPILAEAVSGDVPAGAPACSPTEEERRCLAPERA